jgi:hypothetical protein
MCAALVGSSLPTGAVVPAVVFAQEQEDYDENIASSIVSDVLDNSGDSDDETNQDATDAGTEDSNQGQDVDQDDISAFGDDDVDLDDINVAIPIGIPIDVQELEEEEEEEAPITSTPPEGGEEEPPEFVAFCHEFPSGEVHCYRSSLEDCIVGEGLFNVEDADCEGVVTFPTGDLVGDCRVESSPQGELFAVCSFG